MTEASTDSGYTLTKLHAIEQLYRLLDAEELGEEPQTEVGWDWRFSGEEFFQVSLSLEIKGTKARNELVRVRMVGTFGFTETAPGLELERFVQYGAPTILVPYIREIVTSLTAKGPFEPQLLAPINMTTAMAFADFRKSTGFSQLEESPELAERFGIEI